MNNPDEYKLYCYDNNHRDELKVLTIKRIKTSFIKDGATAFTCDYAYRIYDTDGVFTKAGKEINVNFDFARGLKYWHKYKGCFMKCEKVFHEAAFAL